MRRRVKFLVSSLMAVAGSLAMINFAQASDIAATNESTGAFSDNESSVVLSSEQSIDINNDADVNNNINICANTGNNEASMNSGDGMIKTGDAKASVTATTVVNKTAISGDFGNGIGDVTVGNDTTGAYSDNEAELRLENEQNIDIDNDADIDNDIDVKAETGDNEAKWNSGDADIETGDVDSNVDLSTIAGITSLELGGAADMGNVEIMNEQTGYHSDNEAEARIENENKIDVDNDADIDNDVDFDANTGDNEANGNGGCSGDASIDTGDANADVKVKTVANITEIKDAGQGFGDISADLRNEMTGACSDNEVDVNLENENKIDIDNDADIDNDIDVEAETGDNEAKYNSGDGIINTGDADMSFELTTKANETAIEMAGGAGDIEVTASNSSTGFGSDNEIDLNLENENEIDLDNDLDVDNDLDLDANTGDNEAKGNNGDGSIDTGDVNVDGSIETIGNITEFDQPFLAGADISVDASNECTGAESDNEVKVRIENENKIDIENDADIDNDVDARFETGDNEAEDNCGDAAIETGDTDIEITADTQSNLTGNDDVVIEDFNFDNIADKDLSGEGNMDIIVNGDEIL